MLLGLLLARRCAFALNPVLDASQYAHATWKIRDGHFRGVITAIAQTPDGYLWLGTEFGLVRFDGVRFEPWEPPPGQKLPSVSIRGLLAARDGTLWIGTADSFAKWKAGKLTRYSELAGQSVWALAEGPDGTVWAGGQAATPAGRLCSISGGQVRCYGDDSGFGRYIEAIYADRDRNLWVAGDKGLWRWKPGVPKLYPMPDRVQAMTEDSSGTLIVAMLSGIRRLVEGRPDAYPIAAGGPRFAARALLRDRDGALWVGTTDHGVVHLHEGRIDALDRSDGLTGDFVEKIFEDREGNIWVATLDGLDRFHDLAVPTMSAKEGLSNATVESVLAAKDGSIWLGTLDGLNRWNNGRLTVYRKGGVRGIASGVREIAGSGLPNDAIESMFQGSKGALWVATRGGLAFLDGGRFQAISGVPDGVQSIAEDRAGDIWVSQRERLFHLHGTAIVDGIPWSKLERPEPARAMTGDPTRRGLWFAFRGAVAYFEDGGICELYKPTDGLGEGHIRDLQLDGDGTLWASTAGGLSRLRDGRAANLTSRNGLPCDDAHWVMEDDDHFYWVYMACGLVRIARSEMDAWAATARQNPARSVSVRVFDISDGVRGHSATTGFSPSVAKSADGKIWFLPWDGVSIVDPRRIPFNHLPPPVHVVRITADGKRYPAAGSEAAGVHLPPLVRDLQIDYTALSLVAPDRVMFRYKLEGWDHDWQTAGNRRQAFYSSLPPRKYRFLVSACNESGVWSEANAALDVTIAPAYYQTAWFRALCAGAFLTILAGLYQLRLRQVRMQFSLRLEERVEERTRIARDLHDTLLQSFQAVLFKFHVVTYRLTDHAEAKEELEAAVEQARAAVAEGRDAVQGLRSSVAVTNNLARAITTLGEALLADPTGPHTPQFRVRVEGTSRDLVPILRDEAYRIAGEALRNSFRHADADRIEVDLHYDQRHFRMRVRDDGKGIDPQVLSAGGRAGHHGLPGMQERARRAGGKVTVWSERDSGTEIELTIPASIAYNKLPRAQRH
jgi:signal transduction histidine kinase/ligand-binding sensor domain-containing protein